MSAAAIGKQTLESGSNALVGSEQESISPDLLASLQSFAYFKLKVGHFSLAVASEFEFIPAPGAGDAAVNCVLEAAVQ